MTDNPAVASLRRLDLRDAAQYSKTIADFAHSLAATRPALANAAPAAPVDAATGAGSDAAGRHTDRDVESLLRRLASEAVTHGLTIFLGATVNDRHEPTLPNTHVFVADLLMELGFLDRSRAKSAILEPLLPAAHAAFVYASKKGGGPSVMEDLVRRLRLRSLGEPACYLQLATFLRQIAELREFAGSAETRPESGPDGPQPRRASPNTKHRYMFVVTTNIDFAAERAFLISGLPFSRLVLHRQTGSLLLAQFAPVVRHADRRVAVGRDPDTVQTRLPHELPDKDRARYEAAYRDISAAGATVPFERIVETAELNRLITDHQAVTQVTLDKADPKGMVEILRQSQSPILLKVCGSLDVEESYVISAEHYYELSRSASAVGVDITAAFAQNPAIFVGFNLLEPLFVLLYSTWLSTPFKNQVRTRLALSEPSQKSVDWDDKLEEVMGGDVEREAQGTLGITPLRLPVAVTLERLKQEIVTESARKLWPGI